MTSQFALFPGQHRHQTEWNKALEEGRDMAKTCPGKDPVDTTCTCPDLVYSTRVRIRTGTSFMSYIYCGCCDLPVT